MRSLEQIKRELLEKGFTLSEYSEKDHDEFYEIFYEIVEAGTYFPHEFASPDELKRCFFTPDSRVYVARSATGVVGGFYIRANFPGRGRHIANAAYMVSHTARGQGLGRLLGEASLAIAKILGFRAMQFNVVLSQNERALMLYKKLGFTIIGTIPEAIRNNDSTYQTGYIMYRSLA